MQILVTIKNALQLIKSKLFGSRRAAHHHGTKDALHAALDRIARIERNYLVLLKRVLEMDGVNLVVNARTKNMTQTVLQTAAGDNKGLNELKPTIH